MRTVDLAEAMTHLSELVSRAAAGETLLVTRRGRPVAQLTAIKTPRRAIDAAALNALTASLPPQAEPAGEFVREMRDGDRS